MARRWLVSLHETVELGNVVSQRPTIYCVHSIQQPAHCATVEAIARLTGFIGCSARSAYPT